MNFDTFKNSLKDDQPPKDISGPLEALWWDAKGNWDLAHETAQEIHNASGYWLHAYLHRKEGDEGNAGYWYSRAGKKKSSLSLEEEWEEIVRAHLYSSSQKK